MSKIIGKVARASALTVGALALAFAGGPAAAWEPT